MSVFEGTARFYRRYRPGVPADLAEVLLRAVPARRPRRLLDLGAGTGLVVQALRDGFDDVIGIEVEPDPLQVTRSTLGLRSGQELRWQGHAAQARVRVTLRAAAARWRCRGSPLRG